MIEEKTGSCRKMVEGYETLDAQQRGLRLQMARSAALYSIHWTRIRIVQGL